MTYFWACALAGAANQRLLASTWELDARVQGRAMVVAAFRRQCAQLRATVGEAALPPAAD